MVAIESVELGNRIFMRVDKYPYNGVDPKTNRYGDIGEQYVFTLYETNPISNIQLASCILRDNGEIYRFGVHYQYHSMGYGTMLITYVKHFASTKGYKKLILHVTPKSEKLEFFINKGFEVIKNVTINDKRVTQVEMVLEPKSLLAMSYDNGHNRILVDKINHIANDPARMDLFKSIVKFLTIQYGDECNIVSIEGEITDDVIEQYGYDILTNVFDDNDLETIISYCRINCFLAQDKERFKNLDEVIAHFNKKFVY